MIATPLIPERWQTAIDTLVAALDGVADGSEGNAGLLRFERWTHVKPMAYLEFSGPTPG